MQSLVLDVETSISNNGNPFDLENKLVCIGIKQLNKTSEILWESEVGWLPLDIQDQIDNSILLIGFNIKFDLHWIRKINIDISKIKVWDCQLAEFLLNSQRTPYPSLDETAERYGLPKKIDNIKLNYWEKGIDTDQIPREELSEYLRQDLWLTEQVYLKQEKQLKEKGLYNLFRLQCADLLVLEEIEWNGLRFNTEKALKKAEELDNEIKRIHERISGIIGGIPFNPASNDHVSAILYGGNIVEDLRIPVGNFKSGKKVGEVRYKIIQKVYELPRLVEPLKNTETKKEGYWEVNEPTLRSLKLNKKAKEIVDLLNSYSKLEKLRGTYLIGYSKLIEKMNWPKNELHGNLNQCVAVTGRLSSSKPNMQNMDNETRYFMESRYEI